MGAMGVGRSLLLLCLCAACSEARLAAALAARASKQRCATVASGVCEAAAASPRLRGGRRLAYHLLHPVSRGEVVQPRVVVFLAGLPGAGKTTIVNLRYRPSERPEDTVVVDLDKEIAQHRRFDPNDPDRLYLERSRSAYAWADRQVEARYQAALADSSNRRIVIEGTGTNAERQVRRMQQAREAGWYVKVLYVHIPLDTAIRRAANRAHRPVTAERVRQYHAKILRSLVTMEPLADEFETYDAPCHGDPAHLLMGEGFVEKTRHLVGVLEARAERRRLDEARSKLMAREAGGGS